MVCFYRSRSDVNADTNNPKCLLYMIDASNSAQVPGESEGAVDAASFMNILKEARNVIILVNKM